jgi:superfamily I DNA/RNA helicase
MTAGQGEPLFLLHGVPKTSYHWRHVIPLLTPHFTVIAPDLRGLGDSEHPQDGFDMKNMAKDIADLATHLGYETFNLAGEDWGASTAYQVAAQWPERVKKLVPQSKLRKGLTMSTFHSLGIRILREDIHHLGYNNLFTIYDSADQMSIVREALKNYRANKSFEKGMVQSKISWLKNKGISAEEFVKSEYYDPENPYDGAVEMVYPFYQDKLRFYNALDFDDILFLVVKLFEAHPEVAKKYSERWKYLMVDEYQDTSLFQDEFITAISNENLFCVGDIKQSIYRFRHANSAIFSSKLNNYC